MTIVVDLGCHTHDSHPHEESVFKLIERFHPGVLFGFDPHPDLPTVSYEASGTAVHLIRTAAWVYDGQVGYTADGLTSQIGATDTLVPCFDFARWIEGQRDVILKMDVEGAEYVLLPHLIEQGADRNVDLLLVEWHGSDRIAERAALVERLRCEVEEW